MDSFEYDGKTYVRGEWKNGVTVWRRQDRMAKPKQGCNLHTTRDACERDPVGCRFSPKTDKRAAYCAKKGPGKKSAGGKSPGGKSPGKKSPGKKSPGKKKMPVADVVPFDSKTMSHLPAVLVQQTKKKPMPFANVQPFDGKTMSHLPVVNALPMNAPVPKAALAPIGAEFRGGGGYLSPSRR